MNFPGRLIRSKNDTNLCFLCHLGVTDVMTVECFTYHAIG